MDNRVTFPDDLPYFLTVEEVSRLLNISRAGAYSLVHTDGFPLIRLGKRIVIPKGGLMRWLDEQCAKDSWS